MSSVESIDFLITCFARGWRRRRVETREELLGDMPVENDRYPFKHERLFSPRREGRWWQ
jgi:hypothetical protein